MRDSFSYLGCGHHDQHIPTAESALRAGPDGKPPINMYNALIFQASIICALSVPVLALKGTQTRRERDEMEAGRAELDPTSVGPHGIDQDVVEESKEA